MFSVCFHFANVFHSCAFFQQPQSKKAVAVTSFKIPDPRPHLNVVFIGHVDAGKSTTCGNILVLTGEVDSRTLEKYEREAKGTDVVQLFFSCSDVYVQASSTCYSRSQLATRDPRWASLVFFSFLSSPSTSFDVFLLCVEKNRETWYYAFIVDINEEERQKGKTVEVGRATFNLDRTRFTILVRC